MGLVRTVGERPRRDDALLRRACRLRNRIHAKARRTSRIRAVLRRLFALWHRFFAVAVSSIRVVALRQGERRQSGDCASCAVRRTDCAPTIPRGSRRPRESDYRPHGCASWAGTTACGRNTVSAEKRRTKLRIACIALFFAAAGIAGCAGHGGGSTSVGFSYGAYYGSPWGPGYSVSGPIYVGPPGNARPPAGSGR